MIPNRVEKDEKARAMKKFAIENLIFRLKLLIMIESMNLPMANIEVILSRIFAISISQALFYARYHNSYNYEEAIFVVNLSRKIN